MTPAWSPILGIIIGLNIVFVGFVMAFIVPKPARTPHNLRTWLGWKRPGYVLIVAGIGYAALSFIAI
ncbi:MAG: hypothetical protein B7Y43_18705 [Sphingomonas sp. 28-62-20]|uniref:hypothetical protein n=1 Tax=Sphingomonas sp. 28-62-20 TaxID=1970433 RepID=UPI000BC3D6B0|nr:MAG: hypothetical protein B7Y43_18705 [Sphingomonas sp. 28-62-20]